MTVDGVKYHLRRLTEEQRIRSVGNSGDGHREVKDDI